MKRIKVRIANGTFSFAAEFPNYRYRDRLARSFSTQTCNDVFDAYLAHCAARLAKLDLAYATLASYGRVMARDKDRTKTSEDRIVALCPRAVAVLKRQLAVRERWQRLGTRIDHEHVFFKDDGEPIRHLHYGWKRWRRSLERLGLRPRAPYKARHSFITWNLMIGKNPLWVAKQHDHSAHLMLDVYANWMEGTDDADIARIEQGCSARMQFGTNMAPARSAVRKH